MRQFPQNFTDHLASGATTLCRCWKLVGNQGNTLGFTDHDRDLTISGLIYAAMSGMEGAEVETQLGLAIGGTEISGALNSDALTDLQISSGVWDNATVETWLVNWADITTKILLASRQKCAGLPAALMKIAGAFSNLAAMQIWAILAAA
jgi:uncharacterized phage protein (TIGR02218 family)